MNAPGGGTSAASTHSVIISKLARFATAHFLEIIKRHAPAGTPDTLLAQCRAKIAIQIIHNVQLQYVIRTISKLARIVTAHFLKIIKRHVQHGIPNINLVLYPVICARLIIPDAARMRLNVARMKLNVSKKNFRSNNV